MGLFGKSKKDKVDNAMHLIDNRTNEFFFTKFITNHVIFQTHTK